MSPPYHVARRGDGLAVAVLAGAATWATMRQLDSRTGVGWRRANYRGATVTLSGGPAVAAGLVVGAAASLGSGAGALVVVAGAAAAGRYDDLASAGEDERRTKGFAGHLRVLTRGRASAGAIKVAVIGATSLAGTAIRTGASLETLTDGCLVAGMANLVNLFDLRPGRALKLAGVLAAAMTPGASDRRLLGAVYGAVAVALPADLGERSMLGDTGANALGATLGWLVCGRSRRTRLIALAVVTALTGVSEHVSFSSVIAANPLLRRVDELGRVVG